MLFRNYAFYSTNYALAFEVFGAKVRKYFRYKSRGNPYEYILTALYTTTNV